MNSNDNFTFIDNLVNRCVQQSDKIVRDEAEITLKNYANNHYSDFLIYFSDYISNETISVNKRIFITIFIKNLISSVYSEIQKTWTNDISQDNKIIIKHNLFSALGTNIYSLGNSISGCISAICKIEFPIQNNFEILAKLIEVSQTSELQYKISALTTIKYIMEDVTFDVNPANELSGLLCLIYSSINSNDYNIELKILCTSILELIIDYIDFVLKDSDNFEKLVNLVCGPLIDYSSIITNPKANTELNNKYVNNLLKCLCKFAQNYYMEISFNIKNIFDITSTIISYYNSKFDNVEICNESFLDCVKICYNFWICLADKEKISIKYKIKSNNYLQTCETVLFQLVYDSISKRTNDDEDDEYSHVYFFAVSLLELMTNCCTDTITSSIINIMNTLLNTKNIKDIKTSLMMYSSILSNKNSIYVIKIVDSSVYTIINYLKHQDVTICRLSAIIIEKMLLNFYKHILDDNINNIIICCIDGLKSHSDNITKIYISLALRNLLLNIKNEILQNCDNINNEANYIIKHDLRDNIIQKYESTLIQLLTESILDTTDFNSKIMLNNNLVNCLVNFIEFTIWYSNDFLIPYLTYYISNFEITLNKAKFESDDIRYSIQENLLHIISAILLVINDRNLINKNLLNNVYGYIVQSFEDRKCTYVGALNFIECTIECMGKDSEQIVQNISGYLKDNLENVTLSTNGIFKSSILILTEIIKVFEEDSMKYIANEVNIAIDKCYTNLIKNDARHLCINLLSDIVVYSFQYINNNHEKIMNILFKISDYSLCDNDIYMEEDEITTKEEIIYSIFEFFNKYIQKLTILNNIEYINLFENLYLIKLSETLNKYINQNVNMVIDNLQLCYSLITDVCNLYNIKANELFQYNILQKVHEYLKVNGNLNKSSLEHADLCNNILKQILNVY